MVDEEIRSALRLMVTFIEKTVPTLATKQDVAEVEARLDAKIEAFRAELKAEIREVRTELKAEIQEVRTELKAEIDQNTHSIAENTRATAENTRAIAENSRAIAENTRILAQHDRTLAEHGIKIADNTAAIRSLESKVDGNAQRTATLIQKDREDIAELRGSVRTLGERFDALIRSQPPYPSEDRSPHPTR